MALTATATKATFDIVKIHLAMEDPKNFVSLKSVGTSCRETLMDPQAVPTSWLL